MFCKNCGNVIDDNAKICPVCNTPVEQKSAYCCFKDLVKNTFGGSVFLVISILVSLYCFLSMVTFIDSITKLGLMLYAASYNYLIMVFVNAAVLALTIITTVGAWIIWAKSRKNEFPAGKMGMLKCVPVYNTVVVYICAILIVILSLLLLVLSFSKANDFMRAFWDSLKDLGIYAGTGVLSFNSMMIPVLIFVILLILAVCILLIIRYTILFKIMNSVKSSYVTGKLAYVKPMFCAVLSIIFGAFMILGGLGSGSVLVGFQNIIYGCTMIFVGVLLVTFKSKYDKIYKLQQTEASINPGFASAYQQPMYTQPQQPMYTQPQQPMYTQPQQPMYSQPQQPMYSQPQQTAYSQPQQPMYTQPQQPQDEQPQDEQPQQPEQDSELK